MPFEVLILGVQMASTMAQEEKHGEFDNFVGCDELILMARNRIISLTSNILRFYLPSSCYCEAFIIIILIYFNIPYFTDLNIIM